MPTKEEKELQQRKTDNEKYNRDKQIAILKASNQMLEDAKVQIREKWADNPDELNKLIKAVEGAQDENYKTGEKQLNATESEIDSAPFGNVSKIYVDKYNYRLKEKGVTDEELHKKNIEESSESVKIVASSDSKKPEKKKFFSFMKKKEGAADNSYDEPEVNFDVNKRTEKGAGYDTTQDMERNDRKEPESHKPLIEAEKIEEKIGIANKEKIVEYPDFDPSSVNPLMRYDIIELPSHGECYASKKGRIPVRELTASDENLIASPNMYANGQLIETILRRCILDKNFDVDKMCSGDRDAVVMWLRATAFGPEYNVTKKNPETGKEYTGVVNLGDFKYRDFNLKGDENGCFDYIFDNGDKAKFRILSFKENQEIQEEIALSYIGDKKYIVYQNIKEIKRQVDEVFKYELEDKVLNEAIDYIKEWADKVDAGGFEENVYSEFVTSSMIRRTYSVNGNTDREYVSDYIRNMRLSDAKKYREYMSENVPGIDFSFEFEIPESDGGGSFRSFLTYDDTVFFG